MNKHLLSIFVILLIFITPFASSQSNSDFTVNNEDPEMETGDYFLYDLDLAGMLDSMEDEDIDEVLENSNSGMRMEYGGDSCLQTGWEGCDIGLMTWEANLTMILSEGSGIDNDRIVMVMKVESTVVSNELMSQDTTVQTIDSWFTADGEAYHQEFVMTEVVVSTKQSNGPEQLNVGDTWTTEKDVESTYNEKMRTNSGEWEHEDEVIETESITTNHNAESVSTVYIGNTSYQTMKVKYEDVGTDEMEYLYLTNSGMPVKMESYQDGSLFMIASLIDYNWTKEPSQASETDLTEESVLPGFTMISVMASCVLAAFFVARKQ